MKRSLLSLAVVGLVGAAGAFLPVQAQQYSQYEYNRGGNRQFDVGVTRLAPGTIVPVSPADQQGTVYLDPGTAKLTSMVIAEDVYDAGGNIALPAGTEIRGTFKPVKGGLRFFADSASINGRYYTMRASSRVLKDIKDPRQTSAGNIAADAGIGAAGGALVGSLFGGAGWGALGGAIAGTAIGNAGASQVVVISDNDPVDLRLEAPLTLRY
ncbi:hypothetical protein [Gloeobacter violaceus]|uniref:Glr1715 protein n=1 Tax=Gloeobacter violaceus (strain ATCC 29082 / PCC 7421) TaxID=251221 RepID=Q7NJW6_GLOVI|nr:hypothetical protein [Gloeobacter violaceus]BAC89656.1 glr1715 [Gloeobacter violaceus PCC 7421]